MKNLFLILILLTTTFVLHGQPKKEKNVDNKVELPTNEIVGTWKLVEFSNFDKASNTWTHPYGRNPNGYFTYSKSGIVNINVSSEIPLKIPKDSLKSFQIKLADFRRHYAAAYFGTYTLDKEKRLIIHHVTGGTIPEYINTDQSRPFLLKSDTLILTDMKTWRRVLVKVD